MCNTDPGGPGTGPAGIVSSELETHFQYVSADVSARRPFFYVYDMGAGRVERVAGPAGCPELKSLESFVVSPPG